VQTYLEVRGLLQQGTEVCAYLEVSDGEAVVLEVYHHLPAGQVPHTQLTTSTTRRNEVTPAARGSKSDRRAMSFRALRYVLNIHDEIGSATLTPTTVPSSSGRAARVRTSDKSPRRTPLLR
jgi:hypothetical protein